MKPFIEKDKEIDNRTMRRITGVLFMIVATLNLFFTDEPSLLVVIPFGLLGFFFLFFAGLDEGKVRIEKNDADE